jgi:hypothetical protein
MTKQHMHYVVASYKVMGNTPDGPPRPMRTLFSYYEGDKENRMYLAGGPQYTYRQYLFDYEVIKDYGFEDGEDYCAAEIYDLYRQDFPPIPDNIEERGLHGLNYDVDGWLSPTGEMYVTGWAGHSNMAADLVIAHYTSEYDDEHLVRHDKTLLSKGWIEIRHGFLHKDMQYRPFATPEQIKFLNKLIELNDTLPNYQKGIQKFFRDWEGKA